MRKRPPLNERLIKRNAIKCLHCDELIESTHVHDFKWCECGKVAVDGGHLYLKRVFEQRSDYEDRSEFYDE